MWGHTIFTDNSELYKKIIQDIEEAKSYIYLETYIFDNDSIGKKIRDALIKKAQEKIEIKVLVDALGSGANESFFKDLINSGGKVVFFRKFQLSFKIIHKNNHRDHRKLLVIDDKILYIGSSNITEKSINWKEINIRIQNKIGNLAKLAFLQNFAIANKPIIHKKIHLKLLKSEGLELIRDIPSPIQKKIRNKQIKLIKKAEKEICIENPYFLPDNKLRKALKKASKKGVKVTIVTPEKSDVRIVDILREKYYGNLYESGINFMFYRPNVLHSKLMIVDDIFFNIGSSNMDYRSSALQFEIDLFGENKIICKKIKKHFQENLKQCKPFDYYSWQKRSTFQKISEKILSIIRYFL